MKEIKMTCGNFSVDAPCVVANKAKHLINKYGLKVRSCGLFGGWDTEDYTTLTIWIMPTKVLNTRRYVKEFERVNKKFIEKYGWEIDFDFDTPNEYYA